MVWDTLYNFTFASLGILFIKSKFAKIRLFAFVGWTHVSSLAVYVSTSGREVARGYYEGAGGGRVAGLPTCAVVFCTVGERPGRVSNSFYRDKNEQVNIGVSDLS